MLDVLNIPLLFGDFFITEDLTYIFLFCKIWMWSKCECRTIILTDLYQIMQLCISFNMSSFIFGYQSINFGKAFVTK